MAVASNSNGDMVITKSFIQVLPHNTPPQFLKFTDHVDVGAGDELMLAATIKGHPSPSVTWFKDCTAIVPDDDHLVKEVMNCCAFTYTFYFFSASVKRFHAAS